LRRWRLLEVDDSAGLAAGRLRIDERVLHFLAASTNSMSASPTCLRPALTLPCKPQPRCHNASRALLH
jgi:hypothetical protein